MSIERHQIGMTQAIPVEPFEASKIGLRSLGSFSLQEVKHAANVVILPFALGEVHIGSVRSATGDIPLSKL